MVDLAHHERDFGAGDSAMTSAEAGPTPSFGGLVAGSRVATSNGWRAVETLAIGDQVLTFDGGLQPVVALSRRLYPYAMGATAARPLILLPAGAIGNARPIMLLPDQPVLAESDLAEEMFGDPFAPIRASAMIGLPGVTAMLPEASVVTVTIGFEEDQAVFVEGQALAVCPAARVLAPATVEEAIWGADEARYRVIDGEVARRLAHAVTPAIYVGPTQH